MEVEGRGGRLVYSLIWIAFRAEEMSLHIDGSLCPGGKPMSAA